MPDLCYVCKNKYPEWLTPCGEWVCSGECYQAHVPNCPWCIHVIESKAKEQPDAQ